MMRRRLLTALATAAFVLAPATMSLAQTAAYPPDDGGQGVLPTEGSNAAPDNGSAGNNGSAGANSGGTAGAADNQASGLAQTGIDSGVLAGIGLAAAAAGGAAVAATRRRSRTDA